MGKKHLVVLGSQELRKSNNKIKRIIFFNIPFALNLIHVICKTQKTKNFIDIHMMYQCQY